MEEPVVDLAARLRQLERLHAPFLVAPRRPLDDVLKARAVRSWAMSEVVPCGGRMYCVAGKDGPRFRSVTLLRSARRRTS